METPDIYQLSEVSGKHVRLIDGREVESYTPVSGVRRRWIDDNSTGAKSVLDLILSAKIDNIAECNCFWYRIEESDHGIALLFAFGYAMYKDV
ncbi:MAG TPA: hypothetical protein VJI12_02590 [archaeon]|nr:hypothetical protein [archaeon]